MTGRAAVARALFGSGVPRGLIAIGILTAIAMGGYGVSSYWMTPWAHTSSGRGALVGYWRGEMAFEPGDTRQVALYVRKFTTLRDILLDRGGTGGGAPIPDLKVVAKVCGPKGRVRYHGHGDVANRKGTRFTFGLAPDGGEHGRHPSEFEGIWDGDRLALSARLYTQGSDSATAEASVSARAGASGRPGAIRFEMRRSTEEDFNRAC